MVEKFSDYEGTQFISEEGTFLFEVTDCEMKDSSKGNPMAVITAKSSAGSSTMYFSLNPKARWKYNMFIKACLNLDTPDKIAAFECDYETIGQNLVGKKFAGTVECEGYDKEVKVPSPDGDGTFITTIERRDSYKIVEYDFAYNFAN